MDRIDPVKARECLNGFQSEVEAKLGKPIPASPETDQLCDAAFQLLADLKRVLAAPGDLRSCGAWAGGARPSEGALQPIREALQGPRIILAP